MAKQLFLFAIICLVATVCVSAQTRTVTNMDLEKYRQQRLQADRDYRENYERLGMPSPDEIEKRLAEKRAEMDRLADKFRDERFEIDRIETAQQAAANNQAEPNYYMPQYDGGYFITGYGIGDRGFRRSIRTRQPRGYFVGGQFWESPPRAIYPMFRPQRQPRPHR